MQLRQTVANHAIVANRFDQHQRHIGPLPKLMSFVRNRQSGNKVTHESSDDLRHGLLYALHCERMHLQIDAAPVFRRSRVVAERQSIETTVLWISTSTTTQVSRDVACFLPKDH